MGVSQQETVKTRVHVPEERFKFAFSVLHSEGPAGSYPQILD